MDIRNVVLIGLMLFGSGAAMAAEPATHTAMNRHFDKMQSLMNKAMNSHDMKSRENMLRQHADMMDKQMKKMKGMMGSSYEARPGMDHDGSNPALVGDGGRGKTGMAHSHTGRIQQRLDSLQKMVEQIVEHIKAGQDVMMDKRK